MFTATWPRLVLTLAVVLVTAEARSSESVRIELKDGQIIEGRAFDLGGEQLQVSRGMGMVKILKRDVVRWDLRYQRDTDPATILVLKDGHEISGNVKFEAGEWQVDVDVGTARYDDEAVLRVIRPSGICSDGSFTPRGTFEERVEQAIEKVRDDNVSLQAEGREYLEQAGFFALKSLAEAVAEDDAKGRLSSLLRLENLKIAIPPGLFETFPDFLTTMLEGAESERQTLLREVFLERGQEIHALLAVLVVDPRQPPSVRGTALDVLQRSGCIRELVDAYQEAVGRSQLAIAVALGDAGIYIGVPTLIEALEVEDPDVYTLAGRKLEEYTGERFGFDPDDPSARRTAQARWTGWWRKHAKRIEQTLASRLQPGGPKTEARIQAEKIWREGNRAWDERQYDGAEALYQKAIELDPTFLLPFISLGVMKYQNLADVEAGIRWFRRALRRGRLPDDADGLRLAYYHLGRIHQLGRDFEMARRSYQLAIEIDGDYADAWFQLGKSIYDEALRLSRGTAQERRELFEQASTTFESGLERLREYRKSLMLLSHDYLPIGTDLPFSRRDYNRSLIQLKDELKEVEGQFAYHIAMSRLALADHEGALRWVTEAIDTPKPHADFHRLRSEILRSLGQEEDAQVELEKARALEEKGKSDG